MYKIVGISGFRGAGKDTLANILAKMLPGSIRTSMASPLKDMVSIMFDWDRETIEGSTPSSRVERMKPDPRWNHLAGHGIFQHDQAITPVLALQRVGTELVRNHVDQDFWLSLMKIRAKSSGAKVIIISDIRFPNELQACDITVRVVRPSLQYPDMASMHISETAHLNHSFDTTVVNDGSIQDLESKVRDLVLPLI